MKTILWAILLIAIPYISKAEQWLEGADCLLTWQAGAGGGPVEGYRLYLEAGSPAVISSIDVGTATESTCGALGAVQGQNRVWVTAYNPAGESSPSTAVRFRLFEAETLQVPAAPLNLLLEPL